MIILHVFAASESGCLSCLFLYNKTTFVAVIPFVAATHRVLYRSLLSAAQVSKGQFRRALDQARLTVPSAGAHPSDLLTAEEVEMLSKRYEVKSSNREGGVSSCCADGDVGGCAAEVNYWKLCEQVEKVIHQLYDNLCLEVQPQDVGHVKLVLRSGWLHPGAPGCYCVKDRFDIKCS